MGDRAGGGNVARGHGSCIAAAIDPTRDQEDTTMTDRDVEREIAANEERAREREDDNDAGVVDAAETLIAPFTDAVDDTDDVDEDEVAEQRRLNDEAQRRDE
jgi:hypothetical protein